MQKFHKPVKRPDLDAYLSTPDASMRSELAYELAHELIHHGTQPPAGTTQKFVELAEEFGIDTIARLWSAAPAVSLPGALWRLYALRTWIRTHPRQSAGWFRSGKLSYDSLVSAAEVIAGVADPPTPEDVAAMADQILSGAFTGDFAGALERASAFVTVAARGRAVSPPEPDAGPPGDGETGSLSAFIRLAEDLAQAAEQFRAGALD